jgi:hypothetical protein
VAGRALCTSSITPLSYLFGPVADEQHDDCGKRTQGRPKLP